MEENSQCTRCQQTKRSLCSFCSHCQAEYLIHYYSSFLHNFISKENASVYLSKHLISENAQLSDEADREAKTTPSNNSSVGEDGSHNIFNDHVAMSIIRLVIRQLKNSGIFLLFIFIFTGIQENYYANE